MRLLVSVRSAAEAALARAAGVDLIDVKEPARGALGRADARVLREIAALLRAPATADANEAQPAAAPPLSWALGDRLADCLPPDGLPPDGADLALAAFFKVGLAGTVGVDSAPAAWFKPWDELTRALAAFSRPVAVAYADWQQARAPAPEEVLRAARDTPCAAFLLDTHGKHRGAISTLLPAGRVRRWVDQARGQGLLTVLAGGLTLAAAPFAAACEPDFVGVRGGACLGGREGTLDRDLLRRWRAFTRSGEFSGDFSGAAR